MGVATIISSPKKVKVIEEVQPSHGRFDLLGKWLGNDGVMMVMYIYIYIYYVNNT